MIRKGEKFYLIAGPCAIESEKQLFETVSKIYQNIDYLRAGAYKPRTSPDSFQGLKEEGLKILAKVAKNFNLLTVTEVLDTKDVQLVSSYTDILQIGARNMQNYALLKEVGKIKKPVLLKRGLAATVGEWLSAAEYILSGGNKEVILCERGIRTFSQETRFTLDLAGAVKAAQKSSLPVIIDPSHATGEKDLIESMTLAAKAAGLDGAMIEVHYQPEKAKCDGKQSLTPREFNELYEKL